MIYRPRINFSQSVILWSHYRIKATTLQITYLLTELQSTSRLLRKLRLTKRWQKFSYLHNGGESLLTSAPLSTWLPETRDQNPRLLICPGLKLTVLDRLSRRMNEMLTSCIFVPGSLVFLACSIFQLHQTVRFLHQFHSFEEKKKSCATQKIHVYRRREKNHRNNTIKQVFHS